MRWLVNRLSASAVALEEVDSAALLVSAAAVAVRLAKLPEFEGKTLVVILPDAGERYLSSVLFEGIG